MKKHFNIYEVVEHRTTDWSIDHISYGCFMSYRKARHEAIKIASEKSEKLSFGKTFVTRVAYGEHFRLVITDAKDISLPNESWTVSVIRKVVK